LDKQEGGEACGEKGNRMTKSLTAGHLGA